MVTQDQQPEWINVGATDDGIYLNDVDGLTVIKDGKIIERKKIKKCFRFFRRERAATI